ncbi:hypothetical protein DFH09DRAFT_154653 [Mycena vulgaris]|nr:hypothetical protein DFH09DRAFT_154653 [Mycena vulgaris]
MTSRPFICAHVGTVYTVGCYACVSVSAANDCTLRPVPSAASNSTLSPVAYLADDHRGEREHDPHTRSGVPFRRAGRARRGARCGSADVRQHIELLRMSSSTSRAATSSLATMTTASSFADTTVPSRAPTTGSSLAGSTPSSLARTSITPSSSIVVRDTDMDADTGSVPNDTDNGARVRAEAFEQARARLGQMVVQARASPGSLSGLRSLSSSVAGVHAQAEVQVPAPAARPQVHAPPAPAPVPAPLAAPDAAEAPTSMSLVSSARAAVAEERVRLGEMRAWPNALGDLTPRPSLSAFSYSPSSLASPSQASPTSVSSPARTAASSPARTPVSSASSAGVGAALALPPPPPPPASADILADIRGIVRAQTELLACVGGSERHDDVGFHRGGYAAWEYDACDKYARGLVYVSVCRNFDFSLWNHPRQP